MVFGGASSDVSASDVSWQADQLLVRPNRSHEDASRALLALEGAETEREVGTLGVSLVRLPAGRRSAVQRRLRASRLFRFVERNYVATAAELPDDPLFPTQWALPRVLAPAAWTLTRGAGVTIAVVDSGVDGAHLDLAPRLLQGYNALTGSANAADDHGHGTRMAGIAVAQGFDGFGVVGLAPESDLLAVKSLDASGSGTYADIAEGIVWAADHGARVISLSLGGQVSSFTLSSAVDYAVSRGVVVVAAGGNSGLGAPSYPAGYADVIAVGAADESDGRATFSNFGPWLDLLAPGVDMTTTDRGGGFAGSTGTSPATALTAAASALVLSVNPALQPSQVASILALTSDDLGVAGFDGYHGWGRLNVAQAVAQAAALTEQPDVGAPSAEWVVPVDGADVEGWVDLAVEAVDDVGVARVEYAVDGVVVAASSAARFAARWDSAAATPGAHLLSATVYDGTGNRGVAGPIAVVAAGAAARCDSPGWTCLPGGGPAKTDCFVEWLVRADTARSAPRQKGRAACTDGGACDGDGVADGVCTFTVGLCFGVDDARLVDRFGQPACDTDDLQTFTVASPSPRRTSADPVDGANVHALVIGTAAVGAGAPQGRCSAGTPGLDCAQDPSCDSAFGAQDGVCGLETTSLAGLGGVETCTAMQQLRVPVKGSGSKRRQGVRTFKVSTRALVADARRQPRDVDVLRLECRPAP